MRLRRAIPPVYVNRLWPQARQQRGPRGQTCPICRRSMQEIAVPVHEQEVPLDVCAGCQFVWFDIRCWPWITWGLAAAMALTYLFTFHNLGQIVAQYGLVPAEALRYGGLTLLSSFFLHAGLLHLIGNAYSLLVFGDNVEDQLGPWRYALLVLLAALAGGLLHLAADPQDTTPCIGASGGISGVIVCYALKFPHARLGFMFRFGFYFRWFHLPAWVALILWLALQSLLVDQQVAGVSNISALAHLGGASVGFLAGVVWQQGGAR